MAEFIALTGIKFGNPDGTVVEFAEGDIVDLPSDAIEELAASGAVEEYNAPKRGKGTKTEDDPSA